MVSYGDEEQQHRFHRKELGLPFANEEEEAKTHHHHHQQQQQQQQQQILPLTKIKQEDLLVTDNSMVGVRPIMAAGVEATLKNNNINLQKRIHNNSNNNNNNNRKNETLSADEVAGKKNKNKKKANFIIVSKEIDSLCMVFLLLPAMIVASIATMIPFIWMASYVSEEQTNNKDYASMNRVIFVWTILWMTQFITILLAQSYCCCYEDNYNKNYGTTLKEKSTSCIDPKEQQSTRTSRSCDNNCLRQSLLLLNSYLGVIGFFWCGFISSEFIRYWCYLLDDVLTYFENSVLILPIVLILVLLPWFPVLLTIFVLHFGSFFFCINLTRRPTTSKNLSNNFSPPSFYEQLGPLIRNMIDSPTSTSFAYACISAVISIMLLIYILTHI